MLPAISIFQVMRCRIRHCIGFIAIFALALLPKISDASQHDKSYQKIQVVDYIDGQFAVDNAGAATYSIPLDVPKIFSTLRPDLRLEFNSHYKGGQLGPRWQLAGLPNIWSCPGHSVSYGAKPVVPNPVSVSGLCFDRIQLVRTSDTEYRTIIDNHSKISSSRNCDLGACDFEVIHPNGVKYEYKQAQNSGGLKSWELTRVSDLNGNAFTIKSAASFSGKSFPAAALRPDLRWPESISFEFLGPLARQGGAVLTVQFSYIALKKNSNGVGCRPEIGWNLVWRILREHEVIVSGSKVNWLIGGLCGKCLPTIDLAHVDLP